MCNFCRETDYIISEEMKVSSGAKAIAELRFDVENREMEIRYGLLGDNGSIGCDTGWTKPVKINYCPICGEKLRGE